MNLDGFLTTLVPCCSLITPPPLLLGPQPVIGVALAPDATSELISHERDHRCRARMTTRCVFVLEDSPFSGGKTSSSRFRRQERELWFLHRTLTKIKCSCGQGGGGNTGRKPSSSAAEIRCYSNKPASELRKAGAAAAPLARFSSC